MGFFFLLALLKASNRIHASLHGRRSVARPLVLVQSHRERFSTFVCIAEQLAASARSTCLNSVSSGLAAKACSARCVHRASVCHRTPPSVSDRTVEWKKKASACLWLFSVCDDVKPSIFFFAFRTPRMRDYACCSCDRCASSIGNEV